MDVSVGERDRDQPAPARGDRRVEQHPLGSVAAGVQQPLVRLLLLVRRPGPDAHAHGAGDRHHLHGLVRADHAGHPTLTFSPEADAYVEEANPSTELRRGHVPAHRRRRQPRRRQLPALPADRHPGQDHEREAAAVLDQQHRRRARRDADLELVDRDGDHLEQQAGARPAARCPTPPRSRPAPGSSGTSPPRSPGPGRSTSCCTRPSATA